MQPGHAPQLQIGMISMQLIPSRSVGPRLVPLTLAGAQCCTVIRLTHGSRQASAMEVRRTLHSGADLTEIAFLEDRCPAVRSTAQSHGQARRKGSLSCESACDNCPRRSRSALACSSSASSRFSCASNAFLDHQSSFSMDAMIRLCYPCTHGVEEPAPAANSCSSMTAAFRGWLFRGACDVGRACCAPVWNGQAAFCAFVCINGSVVCCADVLRYIGASEIAYRVACNAFVCCCGMRCATAAYSSKGNVLSGLHCTAAGSSCLFRVNQKHVFNFATSAGADLAA